MKIGFSPADRFEDDVFLSRLVKLCPFYRIAGGVSPITGIISTAGIRTDACQRERRDDLLKVEIQRVYDENHSVYGVRKVCRQLLRENISVARCTVARLMKAMGRAGVLRGKNTLPENPGGSIV